MGRLGNVAGECGTIGHLRGATVTATVSPAILARLSRDPAGLVAAVVQQYDTGEVLMLAWMDDEALRRTLATRRATYRSPSRRSYWVQGETSGRRQDVRPGARA